MNRCLLMCFFVSFIMGVYPTHARESRSGIYVTGGGYYNGIFASDKPDGLGLFGGVGYRKSPRSLFSSELLIRCGYLFFRNGNEFVFDHTQNPPLVYVEPDFGYHMLLSQAVFSPKIHIPLDNELSLFLGGELSFILINGKAQYGDTRRSITDNTWGCGFFIGGEKVFGINTLGCSIGYSEFSYRDAIIKNKPNTFSGAITTLDSWFHLSIFLKRFF